MENKFMPLVSLRGVVMFPDITLNFDIARKETISAVKYAFENSLNLIMCTQKDSSEEKVSYSNLYRIGTVTKILQITKIHNSYYRVIAKGLYKAEVVSFNDSHDFLACETKEIDTFYDNDMPEIIAYTRMLKNKFTEYFNYNKNISLETLNSLISVEDSLKLCNLISSNLKTEISVLQQILSENNIKNKLYLILDILNREIEVSKINKDLDSRVNSEISTHQKEYFLNEKLKLIKEELGDDEFQEAEEYKNKIDKLNIKEEYKEKLLKEVKKLSYTSFSSPEAGVIKTYLDTVISLPWDNYTKEEKDLRNAINILNSEHYGLEKVKDKISDYLAVKIDNPDYNGTIICLAGPPGVGKTSIGKSIAKALGRKYVRISLGGLHDESEIRGHRRTYIGSVPGKIISAMQQANVINPLILLDEIDKLGSDYKGDPSSAMLEVLDSEQNFEFRDNYIDIPFNLSKAVFITTANDVSQIPEPLKDRMEIIYLDSYTFEEKLNIAKEFLIPKQLKTHNLDNLFFEDKAIEKIIVAYTKEGGVRELERNIVTICRKTVRNNLISGKRKKIITEKNLSKYLGKEKFLDLTTNKINTCGIANGLAWTSFGGDLLKIEVSVIKGEGKTEVTGNLGSVMQESVKVAYSYLKKTYKSFNISYEAFSSNDVHIHFPEGAVPKDGPSAGITIFTALVSAFTGKMFNPYVAMTGELTITGNVLAIGGLKEKSLAALRYGIKTLILPFENKSDVYELPSSVKENMKIVFVKNGVDVIKYALVK